MAEPALRLTRAEGAEPAALAEAFAAARATGRVVKDEEETLLVREEGDAGARWWKLYRVPPRRRAFALLARSRAGREWRALRAMQAAGLPVVAPLAFGEARPGGVLRGSLLLTAEAAGARDLRELWAEAAGQPHRFELAEAAGRAAARLHEAGFGHFRMQLRNLLRDPDGAIRWLDAPYACRWRGPAPRRVRVVDLVDLCGDDAAFGVEAGRRCLLAYAAEAGWAPPLEAVRGRGRPAQKLRRIAYYLLAVNFGRRIPPTP